VCLKERKLGVTKPRLREKGGGEVAIPAYEAVQENGMSQRMLDVLMRGISTRQYAEVLPEMASTCGVSKSTVSREAAEAGEAALKELVERRFEGIDLLVIYIDGMQFGEHHGISAVGVDRAGHKHVLGMQQGATENAAAVEDLLGQLVARGVDSKAKRDCANWPTGWSRNRRRQRTVCGEGLEECFTINRLGIPPSLHRCLATTNLIESPQSGVRMQTRRVCRWRDAAMVQRWAAASFLSTEKNFRRLMGWKDLWQLETILGRKVCDQAAVQQQAA